MDLKSSSSSISSSTITDNRGRPTSRGSGGSSPLTRERSRSSCRTDVFLPKSSHIHVKRQESDRSNRDRITRFASPSRAEFNRHEVIVPRVQQSYHTSLSAVVPAQRFNADKENHDDYASSEGSSYLNTSHESDKGSFYSEVEGANYWNSRRNARPYASLPVSQGHILNDRVQALNRRADELIRDHCLEQERFRQELYDIATGKPPRMSQNSNDTPSSCGSSPLKSPSPSRSPPGHRMGCSTPKSKDENANNNGDYSQSSGDSLMQSASVSDSALQNGAVGVGPSSNALGSKEVKVSRSASERSHCTTNGSAKDNFSKRTVGPQYYYHEKKVTYYDLVEKFGDIGDDPEARVAMKELGMLKGNESGEEPHSVPSTPKSSVKSETRSDHDTVSTTSSKKSLAVTISNFIKKMSPRMHRKSSRSSERSCNEDGNSSGCSSVSGSPAHKPSRSKSPLSSPIRKLMGHSGRRSREQSPVSASRSNSSENDSGDRSESSSQRSDKSGQKFDNNTRVMLKSIEDNKKTEKSVYQNFKGRQKSGDAEQKPKRVESKSGEVEKQPVRVKKASDPEAPTVMISEVSAMAQPMRSPPPPQSLNIRSIARLSKKGMKSTVSNDSIGECSLDVTMTGSEPSIASGNGHHSSSVSKHTLLSQDNIGAPIGQNAHHQSSSDSELTNIAAQTERDDSGKVQSYVHLSCALGGYNSSNKYTTYSPDDKKVGKNNSASSLVKGDGVKIEVNGKVPEVNGHVCVPEQNGSAQRDSVIQDDDVFVTGTQTADRTVTKPPQNMVISRQPVATSASGDAGNRLSSSGDKHVVISTEPGHIPDSNSLDKSTAKDGNYYLDVVRRETVALEALSARAEEDLKTLETNPDVSEEVCGIIRAAIGKAKLLVTQKFEQFKGLCHENLTQDPSKSLRTTSEDLGGFWDMVMLQVEDVQNQFQDINEMKNNRWKVVVKVVTVKRTLSSSSQKSNDGSHAETKTGVARPKTPRGNTAPKPTKTKVAADRDKAREEARKRLMEAKKAARRKRMNSQSNDEVEIFISDPHTTAPAN